MISLQDLIAMKEQNEQIIKENNVVISDKQKQNIELESENRVVEKLIVIEQSKSEEIIENI